MRGTQDRPTFGEHLPDSFKLNIIAVAHGIPNQHLIQAALFKCGGNVGTAKIAKNKWAHNRAIELPRIVIIKNDVRASVVYFLRRIL